MSVRVMTTVWDCDMPTQAAKLIALKLADCANDDGANVYPSAARVERETGCSTSTVREVLALLEAQGLLVVDHEGVGNRTGYSTTVRRFDLARLAALADGRLVWTHEDRPVIDAETGEPKLRSDGRQRVERVWTCAPPVPGGAPGTGAHPSGHYAHPSGQPQIPHTPYKDNPSKNRPSPTQRAREVDHLVENLLLTGGERRVAIVQGLLEPLLRQRSFSAPDPVYALGELAEREDVAALDADGLARVCRLVLERRAAVVKPHDVQVAAAEVALALRRERAAAEQERESGAAAAPAGRLVTQRFDVGSPEFSAKIASLRMTAPSLAARYEAQGFVIVKGPPPAACAGGAA